MTTKRSDEILREATRLFAEKGYAHVSTEDIAKAAAVSQGLVHYHFGRKEDLLKEILEQVRQPLVDTFRHVIRMPASVKVKLRVLVQAFVDTARLQNDASRIVMFEGLSAEDTRRPLLAIREANQRFFCRLVREGVAKEEFRQVDERVGALFIGGIIREAMAEVILETSPLPPDAIADEVVQLIYEGLGR